MVFILLVIKQMINNLTNVLTTIKRFAIIAIIMANKIFKIPNVLQRWTENKEELSTEKRATHFIVFITIIIIIVDIKLLI